MTDYGKLPPYDDIKATLESSRAEALQPRQATGHSNSEDPDATVVLLCHYDKTLPNKKRIIGSCNEAVLLPATMNRAELMLHLQERTAKNETRLHLKDHEIVQYGLAFDNGKRPFEVVIVGDDENWQACRMLMRKTPDAKLMFYAYSEHDGAVVDEKTGTGSRSGKKCVVQ